MSKREKARTDAQFARGEVGVDGQAVEAQVDETASERTKATEQYLRGKAYLGREFLTWLLYRSESGDPLVNFEKAGVTVLFTGRTVLRGIAGEVTEMITRGAQAPYSVLVRQSLDRGLLVQTARLRLTHGEKVYEVTLDADFLDVKSAKLPELLSEEEDDQVTERLFLVEQLSGMLQALLEAFLQVRGSKKWSGTVVPALKAWMRGEA